MKTSEEHNQFVDGVEYSRKTEYRRDSGLAEFVLALTAVVIIVSLVGAATKTYHVSQQIRLRAATAGAEADRGAGRRDDSDRFSDCLR